MYSQNSEEINKSIQKVIDVLHSNKFSKTINYSILFIIEYTMYILGFASFFFAFIMHKVFPFHVLNDILYKKEVSEYFSISELQSFNIGIRAIVLLIAILFFGIAYVVHRIRMREKLVHSTIAQLQDMYKKENVLKEKSVAKEGALHAVELKDLPNLT